MKGYRLQVVGYSFLAFVLLSTVHCTLYPVYAADLGQSRINPASPLYFLKGVREILEIKFAGTTRVKALRQLEFSTRRIREVKSLSLTNKQDLIEPTLERYMEYLREFLNIADLTDKSVISELSVILPLHMNILQTLSSQVSDLGAKRFLRVTVNRLSLWDTQLISKLTVAGQTALARDIAQSKLSGCNFLSKEASGSALNEVEKGVYVERAKKCLSS